MRKPPWLRAEPYRVRGRGFEDQSGVGSGAFLIPHPKTSAKLAVIAQAGEFSREDLGDEFAWDHVSVSMEKRIPHWDEMAFIKSIFWDDGETVIQFHVPASDHVNIHPYVLHLWKPLLLPIPRPPARMV